MKHKSTFSMGLTKVLATSLITLGLASMANADDAWPHGTDNIRGMCYQPKPSNSCPTPPCEDLAGTAYYAADPYGEQWCGIWGTGTQTWSTDCIDIHGYTARDDVGAMAAMGVNVIRTYSWANCYQSCQGASMDWTHSEVAGAGHQKFLDYCHSKDIKVIVQVANEYAFTYDTSQFDDIVTSCLKMNHDGTLVTPNQLHEAIHSFALGNEPTNGGASDALRNCVKLANYALGHYANLGQVGSNKTGLWVTIPTIQGTPRVGENTRAILTGEGGNAGWPMEGNKIDAQYVNNANAGDSPGFYMSFQVYVTNYSGLVSNVLDDWNSIPSTVTKPPFVFTEYGWTAWEPPAIITDRQTQGEVLGGAAVASEELLDNRPDFKGIAWFQWVDDRWKVGSENYFGLNTFQIGNVSYTVNGAVNLCGDPTADPPVPGYASWAAIAGGVTIDPLTPVPYSVSGDINILDKIKSVWMPTQLLGDVNADGVIDNVDLNALRELLGVCPTDINVDGVTDLDDFSLFLIGFGTTCDTPARAALMGAHDSLRRGALNRTITNSQR